MTTIYHGYTKDETPKPATLQQLRALLEKLQGLSDADAVAKVKREHAMNALDNAIDCLVGYRKWIEFSENQAEENADAQERADLYEMGMGR